MTRRRPKATDCRPDSCGQPIAPISNTRLFFQSLYPSMLLMCYNLLFTATPIFFHSLLDENIPRFFLAEFPVLYRYWRAIRKRFLTGSERF